MRCCHSVKEGFIFFFYYFSVAFEKEILIPNSRCFSVKVFINIAEREKKSKNNKTKLSVDTNICALCLLTFVHSFFFPPAAAACDLSQNFPAISLPLSSTFPITELLKCAQNICTKTAKKKFR